MKELSIKELQERLFDAEETIGKLNWYRTAYNDVLKTNLNFDNAVYILTNACSLIDGWHNDGTEWSDWDEEVRLNLSKLLKECIDRSSNPIK